MKPDRVPKHKGADQQNAYRACNSCGLFLRFGGDYDRPAASHFRAGMLRHFLDVHLARMSLGGGALRAHALHLE